jgi:hypothetical protein
MLLDIIHRPVYFSKHNVSETGFRFTPWERAPGTHWRGGWVDPRAGLDEMEKRKLLTLPGLELRPFGRPARSQSLYRPRHPDVLIFIYKVRKPSNFDQKFLCER